MLEIGIAWFKKYISNFWPSSSPFFIYTSLNVLKYVLKQRLFAFRQTVPSEPTSKSLDPFQDIDHVDTFSAISESTLLILRGWSWWRQWTIWFGQWWRVCSRWVMLLTLSWIKLHQTCKSYLHICLHSWKLIHVR